VRRGEEYEASLAGTKIFAAAKIPAPLPEGACMSRKNVLAHIASAPPPAAAELASEGPPRQRAGAINAMGRIFSGIRNDAARAEELQRELANVECVVAIDPECVDPSPIRDRIADPSSDEEAQLRASISESGQRVPVLLRPRRDQEGRYFTVFGHRRIAVAKSLGIQVRAIVLNLTEEDALIAQGQENNDRKNTSFIERCLYASRLKLTGMKSVRIAVALATTESVVSTMISIVRSVPEKLILQIGPAPAVGRPRWQLLAEALGKAKVEWSEISSQPDFLSLPTDERFGRVLKAVLNPASETEASLRQPLADRDGKFAVIRRSAKSLSLTIPTRVQGNRPDGLSFADWLEQRISRLHDDWRNGR